MHPQVEIVHRQVVSDIADLLLPTAPDFLHVVEVLFDRRPIGERFDNRCYAGTGVRAVKGIPTMLFFHQHDANHAAGRLVSCQERFVLFRGGFAVDGALDRLPAARLTSAFGQTDAMLAIHAWPAATTTFWLLRYVAQVRVFVQAPHDHHARQIQHAAEKRRLRITAVDDDPHGFPRLFQQWNDPLHQPGRQLQENCKVAYLATKSTKATKKQSYKTRSFCKESNFLFFVPLEVS